jgi:hypothetical protein
MGPYSVLSVLGIGVEDYHTPMLSQVVCLYCQQAGGVSRQQNANQPAWAWKKNLRFMPFKRNATAFGHG